MHIRPYQAADWPQLWSILSAVFATGDTYAFAPTSTEAEIHTAWVQLPKATLVAVDDDDKVLGTYFFRPNHPGLGGHVGNCGYAVAPFARGRGVATALCEHSQALARELGFRAIQFNFVVSTNTVAVRLWQKLGFAIVGTLPGAFLHSQHGYVDAYVMFKSLVGVDSQQR